MSDPDEDFENYLRQFRLRPPDARAPFARPAARLRIWWISGIIAALAGAAIITVLKTQATIPDIENQAPPTAPVTSSPSPSTPAPAFSPLPEPPPRVSHPRVSKPKVVVPQAATAIAPVQAPPPENKGQQIFERVCSACHDLGAANTLRLATRADYESYVAMKRSKGAQLSDEEFPILVDYLFQRFGKK